MAADCCDVGKVMIDKLPDDVLLDIFDFYLDSVHKGPYQDFDAWHTLVHVCRRWRDVVFASPRRLDLRLVCKNVRSVRDMLDIWPPLPINIEDGWGETWEDNTVAALGHRDRVRSINLAEFLGPRRKTLVAEMQLPFPELAYLELSSVGGAPVLPNWFLGGYAPRLRTFRLTSILFPALLNLLLSANDLVDLKLDDIPHSGYIPPASMVACLSSLNKLTSLSLGFQLSLSRPDQPSPPPQSRVVLPVLTKLVFDGASEYSEDLLARIDTPVINQLHITFCLKPIFDVPHLKQFIDRAKGLEPSKAAELRISEWTIHLDLQQPCGLSLGVGHDGSDWGVSSLALLCGQFSHLFPLVERLDLQSSRTGDDDVVDTQFLEFFQLFTATHSLNVSGGLVLLIASALQELIGARATEVLPNLRDIFLKRSANIGPIQEVMQPFVDARGLCGRPVAVHYLDGKGRAVQ